MRTAPLSNPTALAEHPPSQATRAGAFAPARERARRRLVTVVFVIYLLLIFEGSIRKWVLPQLSFYVFFIRDPFLLFAYVYATLHGLWPKRSPFLVGILLLSALGFLVGIVALMANGGGDAEAMLAVYGWRNYFLYAPLAFLVGAQFSTEDLTRVCRWTLLLCVPIGLLVAAQFSAPLNSPINVGNATDAAFQFVGLSTTAEHTRPMGTFSSGAGQNQFVASAFALLLALLIAPPRSRKVRRWVLLAGAGGLATCLALGGSRGAVLQCALIAAVGMGLGLVGRTAAVKLRSIGLPVVVAAIFAVLYPMVFPEGFEAFSERWQAAEKAETKVFETGVFGRALYGLTDFTDQFAAAPVFGYGLGMGGNASLTLNIAADGVYAESDWARHIVDLGLVMGPIYIVMRIVLTVWLGLVVLRATRRGAGPLPMLLFAYTGYVLLAGQITGQGAINGYAWLFMGFTLAAAAARSAPDARRPGRAAKYRRHVWPA